MWSSEPLLKKGTTLCRVMTNIGIIPITRFFSDMGAESYTVNIATEAPSHELYNGIMDNLNDVKSDKPRIRSFIRQHEHFAWTRTGMSIATSLETSIFAVVT